MPQKRRSKTRPRKTHKSKTAIFDIDGTIFRSSLLIEVTNALIEAGIFPEKVRKEYAKEYRRWLDRRGAYGDYIDAVVRAFMRNIKGVHYRDFLKAARKVVAGHKNRTYVYPRGLVQELKKKGYYLLAVSQSPKGVVDSFAKSLGFDKVYGSLYETDKKGRYTGQVLFPELLFDKEKLFRRAIGKEGLTLTGSVGVGDTESDIGFLKMVERPICFNPNRRLYEHAKRRGWEVVIERKDLIYKVPRKALRTRPGRRAGR
jgi:HAD superfamily hydrolase (TIGR01490 family)